MLSNVFHKIMSPVKLWNWKIMTDDNQTIVHLTSVVVHLMKLVYTYVLFASRLCMQINILYTSFFFENGLYLHTFIYLQANPFKKWLILTLRWWKFLYFLMTKFLQTDCIWVLVLRSTKSNLTTNSVENFPVDSQFEKNKQNTNRNNKFLNNIESISVC